MLSCSRRYASSVGVAFGGPRVAAALHSFSVLGRLLLQQVTARPSCEGHGGLGRQSASLTEQKAGVNWSGKKKIREEGESGGSRLQAGDFSGTPGDWRGPGTEEGRSQEGRSQEGLTRTGLPLPLILVGAGEGRRGKGKGGSNDRQARKNRRGRRRCQTRCQTGRNRTDEDFLHMQSADSSREEGRPPFV